MYSDKWLMDSSNKKTNFEILKDSIYCYYWQDKDNNKLSITINFEYADDCHIEILYENLLKVAQILFDITKKKDIIESLREYFKDKNTSKKEEFFELKKLLNENNIEYKVICFY